MMCDGAVLVFSPRNEVQGTQQSAFSVRLLVCGFVSFLTASDWSKFEINLSNTTKRILLDSLLPDDTAGAIIQGVFFLTWSQTVKLGNWCIVMINHETKLRCILL